MLTFLHTADWHLGMTRRFLAPEAQARYAEARIEAVREIGRLADREGCAFVLVCGDAFDSNQVDRQVVVRALDSMAAFTVPVMILPGNHDAADAASVYSSRVFRDRCPDTVIVLDGGEPVGIAGTDCRIISAPWPTRHPGSDLAAHALADLMPDPDRVTVLVAHGAVDALSPDKDDPALVRAHILDAALESGAVAYVALGDRHSVTSVGDSGRIWYPGTPLTTDFGEGAPNQVLVVRLDADVVQVDEHRIGGWTFMRHEAHLDGAADVDVLDAWLAGIGDKARTVVRLALIGTLTLAEDARLWDVIGMHADLLASLTVSDRRTDLAVAAGDGDLADLGLSGYAADAAAELAKRAAGDGDAARVAQDALRTLFRLAAGAS